ncbi:MAG: hypothetical protein WBG38_05260, partial [Nodosilinea sp.]
LEPGDWHPIKIGDRLWLGGNQINVVEDEEDTVPPDEVGPPTEASTTPLDYRPPAPAPAPPRTYADAVYFAVEWAFTGRTIAGKIYRFLVASGLVGLAVVLAFK